MTQTASPRPHGPATPDGAVDRTLLTAVLAAGLSLAEALRAENEALAALDLARAARLAETKVQATDAFAAAHAAAAKLGARAEGEVRRAIELLATQLQSLGMENRRLLERAVTVQSRVIEAIAGAALPRNRSGGAGYGPAGHPPRTMPLAITTRA